MTPDFSIPSPSSAAERDERVEEVRQHAAYTLEERDAQQIDRVAGESSFIVHFYHWVLRGDILRTRNRLGGGTIAPLHLDTSEDIEKIRRVWYREKKLADALRIGVDELRDILANGIAGRWNHLRLGESALILGSAYGLPAGLPVVRWSTNINNEAGTGTLYEHWRSAPAPVREQRLLNAARQERPWASQVSATITLEVLSQAAISHVLSVYDEARYSLLQFSDDVVHQLVWGDSLRFETHEYFDSSDQCLQITIASNETLPNARTLRPWLTACLRKHSQRLQRGGSKLTDEAIRLWTTGTLVDFAGLANRRAMEVWDKNVATRFGISQWGATKGLETQTSETSFSHSRSEVFAPRRDFYLRLLSRPTSDT